MLTRRRWSGLLQRTRHAVDHAVEILYPDHSRSNPIPPALPSEQYVGTYYHPAYQNMTLELGETKKGTGAQRIASLKADRTGFTWQTVAEFEHVFGEYWIMYNNLAQAPHFRELKAFAAVEFKIDANGKPSKLGIEWRDLTGGVDGWIWYDRID